MLANIKSSEDAPRAPGTVPNVAVAQGPQRFSGLTSSVPSQQRKLYFSETFQDPTDDPASYFITVEGATPKVFDMNFTMPDITVTQGTVEDWTMKIELRNRTYFIFINCTSSWWRETARR